MADAAPSPLALALGGLLSLAAAMGIGRFVYTPILPAMVEDLGLTSAEAGLIASANFLGYLAGAILAALPALPGSRRTWMLGALAASALTTAAMGAMASMAAFLALRFLGGLASAFVLVFSSALVLDRLAASGRAGLSALHFSGVGFGIAVSAVLVAGLDAADAGWRALWLASGAASAAAVVAVARLVPDRAEPPIRPPATGSGAADAALARLVAAYGLFGFGYVITATFLVAIVRASPEIATLETLVWLVVGLAGAPSVALWMRIGARIGLSRAYAAACLVEALGVIASVLWIAAPGVLLAAALLGGTFMALTALGLAEARRLSRGDPRRAIALMTVAFSLGQIVGPVFAGLAHDRTGSFALPSIAAAGALVLAAILASGIKAGASTGSG